MSPVIFRLDIFQDEFIKDVKAQMSQITSGKHDGKSQEWLSARYWNFLGESSSLSCSKTEGKVDLFVQSGNAKSNPSHTFLFWCISYKTVFMTQQLTTGSLELMVWWSFLSSDLEVDSVAEQSPAAPAGAWQHIFATGGRATVVGHHSEGAVSQQHCV